MSAPVDVLACYHSAIAPNMNRCIKCGREWDGEKWVAPAARAVDVLAVMEETHANPLTPTPSDLPTLSPDEIAEGDARQEHC